MKKFFTLTVTLLLLCSAFSGFAQFGASPWIAPSGTYTIPAGVTQITVTCYGGGGAGGGASATSRNGGGGGGGACVTVTNYTVTPGQQITVAVGAGGTGVSAGTGNTGGNSTVTLVTGAVTFIRAAGGAGGTRGASSSSAGAGGAGGAIANNIPANTGFKGGNGGSSNPNTGSFDQSGGGGGGAGTTAAGSNGTIITAGAGGATGGGAGGAGISTLTDGGSNGTAGAAIGGGGGGSTVYITGSRAGAAGAAGRVVISYTSCTAPTISAHPATAAVERCLNGTGFPQLSVTANGTSPGYQWYSNTTASNSGGSIIASATASTYTPLNNAVNDRYYYVVVTNSCGSTTSNASGLQRTNPLAATPAITSNSPQCVGTGVTFTQTSCPAGSVCFWQVTATDFLQTNSNATYTTATTLGTYNIWLRARVTATGCWSSAATASGSVNASPTAPTLSTITNP